MRPKNAELLIITTVIVVVLLSIVISTVRKPAGGAHLQTAKLGHIDPPARNVNHPLQIIAWRESPGYSL